MKSKEEFLGAPASSPASSKRPTGTSAVPGMLPKLRFPEFRGGPVWEDNKLGSVCDLYQPVTLSAAELSMTGEYLVYGANGVIGSHNEYNHEDSEIAVTCRGATCGELTITKPKSWITGNAMVVKPRTSTLRKDFVFHYLKKHGLKSVISGSAQPQITRVGMAPLAVFFPEIEEQQKIAECLSTLDELIGATSQKLDALKAHKKGLMQQLFPREGETLPRLRFPEFRDAPEWKVVPMGELLSGKPEYGVNAAAVAYSESLPTYLRITDIDDDGRFIREGKVSVDVEATEENQLRTGDVVLARTGASVGKSYRYQESDGPLVFAGFLIRIRPNQEKVSPVFLSNFLRTNQYWEWVRVTSTRSGQPGLNGSEYASFEVSIPPPGQDGLLEQHRIASCLSSLDDLIAAQSDQLEALKTHKQGLMQQLFPSPAEEKA